MADIYYTFDQIFAADPANPALVATSGSVTIFAPGDTTMTPLPLLGATGNPLPNPVPINSYGFGPAFQVLNQDRVAWAGGGFSGFFTSYEGIKNVAVAAQAAVESLAQRVTAGEFSPGTPAAVKNSVFIVRYTAGAWEYASLAAAKTAGLNELQTVWFVGSPTGAAPSWARPGDVVTAP